jgi:hypothetical protein
MLSSCNSPPTKTAITTSTRIPLMMLPRKQQGLSSRRRLWWTSGIMWSCGRSWWSSSRSLHRTFERELMHLQSTHIPVWCSSAHILGTYRDQTYSSFSGPVRTLSAKCLAHHATKPLAWCAVPQDRLNPLQHRDV